MGDDICKSYNATASEEAGEGVGSCVTSEGRLPPEAVPDLHVVIPAQAAAIQIHGREVQNDLGDIGRGGELHGPLRLTSLACQPMVGACLPLCE